jgi:SAM-dependent methyltransferase
MSPHDLKVLLAVCFEQQTAFQAILSNPSAQADNVVKISVRPVHLRGDRHYQLTRHQARQTFHENIPAQKTLEVLWPLIGTSFFQAVFFTADADFHILVNKKGHWSILKKKPSRQLETFSHNKKKNHALSEKIPVPFLIELGVMRSDGSVFPKMAHKFRQINRFVEIVADIVPQLPQGSLHIIDFGCGKSYLTFAMYHYFHHILQREVSILGLDLKSDVITACQALAEKVGFQGLRFQIGDINTVQRQEKVDMVVSLHACDTATDAALEKAIQWQAEAILCAPCCQHELYGQVQMAVLDPLLKHGILRERFAALVTDAARAQLLEVSGYRTQVMEFIDMEHTPKNLLIRAIRGHQKKSSADALPVYRRFADALHILPSLEKRLDSVNLAETS